MTDHHALIEQARRVHYRVESGCECQDADHPRCWVCYADWPCLTARLVEALEQAWPEGANRLVATLAGERDAALACTSAAERQRDAAVDQMRLEQQAHARITAAAERRAAEWKNLYEHGQVERRKLEEELSAAERRVAEHDEMFERQAKAVRHHTARANALEHRSAELEMERDEAWAEQASANARSAGWSIDLEAVVASSATLARDLAAAREALTKYGQHQLFCPAGAPWAFANAVPVSPSGPCSCGLDAALGAREGEHGS